ncbi:MAG: hypothetical protein JEZ09_00235 [Salinivirgaceae bacterium]|nr:hypothetical protein [Salinivirgaceae bacterium]
MSENKNTPQEIDLIELFSNIGNWFGKQINCLFNIVLKVFYFFVRNALWFALFIVLGIIGGYISHKVTNLYYHSEMIGYSHTINNIEVIQSINNWNYTSEFTEDELEKIKTIGATYLLDINGDGNWDMVEDLKNLDKMDTTIMKQRIYGKFCILVEVFDTSMIAKINTKVIDYLSKNKRVIERNQIRLQQMEEIIPKLKNEIAELDSLKRMEYFEKNKPTTAKLGDMILLGEKETKLYHQDVLALVREQQKIERDLFLNKDPFEIILDFSVPTKEENNVMALMITFAKISLLLGFLVILFFDQRKFIINQLKKSKEKII